MKRLEAVLDQVLEKALEKALASLEVRATAIVEESLGAALESRLKALLGEEALSIEAPTSEAPTRAKAKAQAQAIALEEAPKTPKRRKAKATPAPTSEDDLTAILEAAKVALGKYSGVSTPRGKPLSEVLYRRVKKTLEHAQSLGRKDIRLLAERAMALINVDPMAAAMGSWKALAERLGLPVPIQGE
jgi:hypothetical protein